MGGKEQKALPRLERAAEPQRLRELRDARAQAEVPAKQVPVVAPAAARAVLRASARDASPEEAWGRRPSVQAHPAETAVEPWAAAPEAPLAVPPLAEPLEAPREASPMLGPEAEQRQDERAAAEAVVAEAEQVALPPLVPQAEGLARVEVQATATQRLGLVRE